MKTGFVARGNQNHNWVCQVASHLAQKGPSMNKFLIISFGAVITVVVAAQAAPPPDLIARIHFAGAEHISADTNSAALTNFFCSAEAQALREQTLNKLSHFPYTWFKSRLAAGASNGAEQLRPLLDDLLKSEWFLEIRDTTNGAPETALAIRLNSGRTELWSKNLAAVLQDWTGIGISQDRPGIWWLKKHQAPNLFQFSRSGDWVVIDCGQNNLSLGGGLLTMAAKPAIRETNWLTADLDWPRLAQWFVPLKNFDFPKIELQFIGRGGDLWANGKFILSQPLPPLEKWRMPTNIIHQPLASFTAVRGIGPWLARQDWARRYEIQPPPDQFFIWALPQMPFQTFAATPVPDAAAAIAQLDAKLPVTFDARSMALLLPPITTVLTNHEIMWRGVPFAAPFVQALHEPSGDFLFGGFFPNTPRSQPLPPELFQQLNTPNLVYYHWEATAERLDKLPQLTQLLLLITQHKQLEANSAAYKWLKRVGPTLGPTVTKVTQTGPGELSFLRKSPGGLAAIELVALANWLEAGNFPGCDLRLPPPPPRPKRPLHHQPGAPAKPVPAKPAPAVPTPASPTLPH